MSGISREGQRCSSLLNCISCFELGCYEMFLEDPLFLENRGRDSVALAC